MKTIYIYILSLLVSMLAFSFTSCIDDKGNYSYTDRDDVVSIKISNLPDDTIVFRNLQLSPILENVKENANYAYRWFCYRSTVIPYDKIIELGNTKDLDADVSYLEPAEYIVFFEVKDVDRNVFVRKKIELSFQLSDVQKGWFFLKEIDGMTDFDYVSGEGVHLKDILNDYTPKGNMRLAGSPKQIGYQPTDYTQQKVENGEVVETLRRQKVYHIISDQEYSVFNAVNLERFKTFGDAFFEPPTTINPSGVLFTTALYFVNAGEPYSIPGAIQNIGKFSVPPAVVEGYNIANTPILANIFSAMMFDDKWKTYKKYDPTYNTLENYDNSKTDPSKPSPTNMDANLLQLMTAKVLVNGGPAESARGTGVALMKNINKDEHYLIKLDLVSSYPFTLIDTLKNSNAPVLKSPIRAALRDGNYVYYTNSEGNELWAYDFNSISAQREQLIRAFPAGEKITAIQDIYVHKDERTTHVVIATSLGGNKWKSYQFPLVSTGNPNLEPESRQTYEGDGTVKYVLLRRS